MLDTTKLYSYQGKEPQILPHRIKFEDGTTKTDVTTFTLQDIERAGYTGPHTKPDYDPETEEIEWNSSTLSYEVKKIIIEEPSPERLMEMVRETRNILLLQSDWTQLPDSPLDLKKIEEWKNYRKNLRDYPKSINTISTYKEYIDLSWPEKPE